MLVFMGRIHRLTFVILPVLFLAACSSRSVTGEPDTGSDTTGDPGVDPLHDTAPVDAPGEDPDPYGTCTPQILILADRSQSMTSGTPPRWQVLHDALAIALQSDEATGVDVGLGVFPTSYDCDVTEMVVAPVPTADAASIDEHLGDSDMNGNTPLTFALEQVLDGPGLVRVVPEEPAAVVVIADGPDNCYIDCMDRCGMNLECMEQCESEIEPLAVAELSTVASALLDEHQIQVFAVGLGPDVSETMMEAMAGHGGTGDPYAVDSVDTLRDALLDIFHRMEACE